MDRHEAEESTGHMLTASEAQFTLGMQSKLNKKVIECKCLYFIL